MSGRASPRVLLGLVAMAAIVWWSPAPAQKTSKVVGYLSAGFKDSTYNSRKNAIAEMARFGFVEGKNLVVEERYANGDAGRLAALAMEVAAARPDAIIAVSNPAIQAAKEAAPSVPIIMAFAGEDPVTAGFVSSLSRPGGSITGLAMLATETEAKRVELAAQALPGAKRMAVLMNPYATAERVALTQRSAAAMGIELILVRAQDRDDYDDAFKALATADVAMLVIGSSPVFLRDVTELAKRAAAIRLPVSCEWREMALQGCLIAYGPNARKLHEKIGAYTGRVLQGAKPQEMPVEQPTTFELVINLKVARELGVSFPMSFSARADEVIE
jgi:putative ABC transport system substrate-binding protein